MIYDLVNPFPNEFVIPFVYNRPEHIKCSWIQSTSSEPPLFEMNWLTFGIDYTVSSVHQQDLGGTLTLLKNLPAEAEKLLIRRVTPKTQEIDLHNGGRLTADLIEDMSNKLTLITQEISEQQLFSFDNGNITIARFSNTTAGLIQGENEDGKVLAESDGTGSVVGWDSVKNRITNLEKIGIANNEGKPGLVIGEIDFEDGFNDGAITVNPTTGKMRLIGFERLQPRVIDEYHDLGHELSEWECAKLRYLPLNFQLIEIALYQELCAIKFCGDDKNNTALWWYKCDHLGNRTVTGLWMRVEDGRCIFRRGAGANAAVRPSETTLYDGGVAGTFEYDTLLEHGHTFGSAIEMQLKTGMGASGVVGGHLQVVGAYVETTNIVRVAISNPVIQGTNQATRTGKYTKPPSISGWAYLTY